MTALFIWKTRLRPKNLKRLSKKKLTVVFSKKSWRLSHVMYNFFLSALNATYFVGFWSINWLRMSLRRKLPLKCLLLVVRFLSRPKPASPSANSCAKVSSIIILAITSLSAIFIAIKFPLFNKYCSNSTSLQ